MKSVKDYLVEEDEKSVCCFQVKTTEPLTDEKMDKLEMALRKYDCFNISTPAKTIMQKFPVDFKNVPASEVWMVTFSCRYPVAADVIRDDLTKAMELNPTQIVVKNLLVADAQDVETDEGEHVAADTGDDGFRTSEYTDGDKIKHEDYFGEDFKKKFLDGEKKAKKPNYHQKEIEEELNKK